jgi:hypothetical protein
VDRFRDYFEARKPAGWNGRVFLPVIHVESGNELESGRNGVRMVYEAGADGAFLIAHSQQTRHGKLTEVARDIREELTMAGIDFPVGVNYLDLAMEPDIQIYEAVRLGEIPMIWSDNPSARPYVEGARVKVGWSGIYFGAVAFKYQAPVSLRQLPCVAKEATWMDVLTTSGEGTGQAIDLEKARIFAEAVPNSVRAVASGASVENIDLLLPYFHAILASTSISLDFHTLDPGKTKELAAMVSLWCPKA